MIDLSGPREHWKALGYTISRCGDTEMLGHFNGGALNEVENLLAAAIATTGDRGEKALGWAVVEQQRRREERTRVTAQAREAEAISALAQAIREGGEDAALERVIGRLSERTQHAVRKQLSR
jgi:hypothetical protein